MKLVIAEKPSVGAAIAAVIGANEKCSGYYEGGGYLVSVSYTHLDVYKRQSMSRANCSSELSSAAGTS